MDNIDLSNLSRDEYGKIMDVMRRDQMLRKQEEQRVFMMKTEIQRLRQMGTIRPGIDQSRVCGRCQSELGRFLNRGSQCPVCRKQVCKNCRYQDDKIVDFGGIIGGEEWICMVCWKQIQFKATSGEWMKELTRSASEKLRSPSTNVIAAATENLGRSLKYTLRPAFLRHGTSDPSSDTIQNPSTDNNNVPRSNTEPNNKLNQHSHQNFNTENNVPPRPFYRSRGPIPPRLPTVDPVSNHVPKDPRSPQSDGSGSQESSPKPPLSPALKVYHAAVDMVNQDASRNALGSINSDRKTVYRKVSNRLLDSSSSEDEEDEEESRRYQQQHQQQQSNSRTSIPPNRSPMRDPPCDRLSNRPNTNERQSSDEYSTTMSSYRSRSTSTETTTEDFSSATSTTPSGTCLTAAVINCKNRRVSPLRKQRAIAEEANDSRSSPILSNDYSTDSLSRYTGELINKDGGIDSGVECGGGGSGGNSGGGGGHRSGSVMSSSSHSGNDGVKNGVIGHYKNPLSTINTINISVNSSSESHESQIPDSDATVENVTGVIFRKVTLKKRLDRSQSNRTVQSEPNSCHHSNRMEGETGESVQISGKEFMANKSYSADEKGPRSQVQPRNRALISDSGNGQECTSPVPHISVSDYSESFSHKGSDDSLTEEIFTPQEEDIDRAFAFHSRSLSQSLSSYPKRSDSLSSIYSAAGGGRYGMVPISGEILFSLAYDRIEEKLEVHIKECRDLAAVDKKRNRSDPYCKLYLLPDRTKHGKRKTRVKRHTLNPNFDELLQFSLRYADLQNRTLWISVWHSDTFGRNDFLGEVMLPLSCDLFKNQGLRWYPLQDPIDLMDQNICYKGSLVIALKFVPTSTFTSSAASSIISSSTTNNSNNNNNNNDNGNPNSIIKSSSIGKLFIVIQGAHNLTATRSNGTSDPFCKSYLLPDKSSKQKTSVMKRTCNPKWNHTFEYEDVSIEELKRRCLELTVWDYDILTSNDFLGGIRLSLGQGKNNDGGEHVDWMDSSAEEIHLWSQMLENINTWVYGEIRLRPTLQTRLSR
ncbi:uncharacterized protein LOC141855450 isoform X2 [Brevipalpus obovatus]|uniref:uncharacterized protein LOC141855450 isoform X2 n=1 Tax=Brevipalpus obovatus TaxID=246614 RepID=UPI003D9E6142